MTAYCQKFSQRIKLVSTILKPMKAVIDVKTQEKFARKKKLKSMALAALS
jgi:hypothetical protein